MKMQKVSLDRAWSESSSFFHVLPFQAANGDELAAAEGQAFLSWRHGCNYI